MRNFTRREKLNLTCQFLAKSQQLKKLSNGAQSAIREYQFRKVKHLLDVAFHNTEFYSRKYSLAGIHPRDIRSWQDFEQVPTVTKSELLDAGLGAVNDTLAFDKLIASRSSGTTGQFLTVYLDAQAIITQALQAYRMLREVTPGYRSRDKEVLVYTSKYPYSSIAGLYRARYISNLLPAEQVLDAILRVKPAVLAIYPSILREVLLLDGHRAMRRHLKGVLTNSEYSTQEERDAFAEQLGCPVSDEFSSEELSSIAHQCLHKRHHLTQDSSYIELLEPGSSQSARQGEVGEVVGTCLINEAMPIIRYHQEDLAVLGDQRCPCGKSAPVLESLVGRRNSSFKCKDGSMIPSGRILDWTYSLILTHRLGIRQFRLTQETVDLVTIDLVVTSSYNAEIHNQLLSANFQEVFGNSFVLHPRIVPSIQRSPAGKYNPIRSALEIFGSPEIRSA